MAEGLSPRRASHARARDGASFSLALARGIYFRLRIAASPPQAISKTAAGSGTNLTSSTYRRTSPSASV
jgi:hypothetical protein